ncbi:MAG TPA: Na+/H+ antiporter NhaA [Porphyromonadaceae bacterium]|nr:Na+/H+ antiporter NhaA [Porphyromonadaceae bacterium]
MGKFQTLLNNEKTSGFVLIACTLLSLFMANSGFGESYQSIWTFPLGAHSAEHWINDGLMVVFFLLVGLELVDELYRGRLSSFQTAMLPLSGALGGMLLPAAIYLMWNAGMPTASGFGIPMATDIAFALAFLSLMGNRVPPGLKVFLMALAVIDDLGAIIVIAVFYSSAIDGMFLALALGLFALLLLLNKVFHVKTLAVYLIGGIAMWYCMHYSGVHATIAGVLLAITIPNNRDLTQSPAVRLRHALHYPVYFFVLPLFALSNTAIPLDGDLFGTFHEPFAVGILLGLVVGKPIGITFFSWLSVGVGLCRLPSGVKWKQLFGAGLLGGIGFTMSIFITLLAFSGNNHYVNGAKWTIMLSSLLAAAAGLVWLSFVLPKKQKKER